MNVVVRVTKGLMELQYREKETKTVNSKSANNGEYGVEAGILAKPRNLHFFVSLRQFPP